MASLSRYYSELCQRREKIIQSIGGDGHEVNRFSIGDLIHIVTDTGIIIVYNPRYRKIVTKEIARPEQLRKLYDPEKPPAKLLRTAYKNNHMGYNEV